jgi:O-antigen ligase
MVADKVPARGDGKANGRPTLFDLRSGVRLLGALVSFEAVFLWFLISVNYKSDPAFAWVPIDLTIAFFGLGVLMGLVIVYREGLYLPGLTVVSLMVVFIAWVMLTALWTPSELYAREKLLKLATLSLWSVIATAMIMANRPERVRRFLVLVLVVGTAASLYGIVRYATADRFALSSSFRLENYIAQSRFFGMAAVVAFAAWLQTSPFSKRGVALTAAFVMCCSGLLVASARGPTLAVAAAILLPLVLSLRVAQRRLLVGKALVASIVLSVAMAAMLLQVAEEYSVDLPTLQRFNVWLDDGTMGRSASERAQEWSASWDFWLKQPLFGSGVGSWPIRYFGLDLARYPHNLILEVLVEFGLVGLFLLAAVAVAALRRISVRRLRQDPVLMCVAMLCVVTFLAAATSEDITGNRNVFAMFGLLVMRPYRRTSDLEPHGSLAQPRPDPYHEIPNPARGRV